MSDKTTRLTVRLPESAIGNLLRMGRDLPMPLEWNEDEQRVRDADGYAIVVDMSMEPAKVADAMGPLLAEALNQLIGAAEEAYPQEAKSDD